MNNKTEALSQHESKKRKIHSFIHTLRSLSYHRFITIPNRSFQTVQASSSSLNLQCLLFSLRSSSSCLHLLLRILVIPFVSSLFQPITWFIKQFLHKMWPIQSPFLPFTVYRILLFSLTVCDISSFLTRSAQLTFWIILQHHFAKLSNYFWSTLRNVHLSAP
jgi:hypothetical protein